MVSLHHRQQLPAFALRQVRLHALRERSLPALARGNQSPFALRLWKLALLVAGTSQA